jgi:type IV secretory pathway VirB2 component (pilin)
MNKKNAKAIAVPMIQHDTGISMQRVILLSCILYVIFSSFAFAGCPATSNNTPMGQVLCTVVNFMYGNLGRGLATLAVITLGVGALLGKVTWGMAITVGVGISVIFNAETITGLMIGCSGANFCP